MNRRDFISLSGLASALLVMEACGSSLPTVAASSTAPTGGSEPGTTGEPATSPTAGTTPTTGTMGTTAGSSGGTVAGSAGVARSNLARATTSAGDEAGAVTALNAFGADLSAKLGTTGNSVFSPASILLTMAMVRAGAVGLTQTEMNTALQIADPATIDHSINALLTLLDNRNGDRQSESRTGTIELDIANSIWAESDEQWEQAFLDLLASQYGAGISLVDYKQNPETARVAINSWVAEQTKQRIPELIAAGVIDTATRMALVNTIYLKAPWAAAFSKTATATAPFTKGDGSTTQADMMHGSSTRSYLKAGNWQGVGLPYVGNELEMVVIVPDAGSLGEVVQHLGEVFASLSDMKPATVDLSMPKFDFGTKTNLVVVLTALGMPTAFTDRADFSGMTKTEPLSVSAVIHQANITVDEEGTVAAAATAAVMTATAMPVELQTVELTIDRPFVFAVRDSLSGAVLFLGTINDPTGKN